MQLSEDVWFSWTPPAACSPVWADIWWLGVSSGWRRWTHTDPPAQTPLLAASQRRPVWCHDPGKNRYTKRGYSINVLIDLSRRNGFHSNGPSAPICTKIRVKKKIKAPKPLKKNTQNGHLLLKRRRYKSASASSHSSCLLEFLKQKFVSLKGEGQSPFLVVRGVQRQVVNHVCQEMGSLDGAARGVVAQGGEMHVQVVVGGLVMQVDS